MWYILLLQLNMKSYVDFRLTHLHMTLPHFKDQVKIMHTPTATVLTMANIIIAIKYESSYGLLIDLFTFDVDPF